MNKEVLFLTKPELYSCIKLKVLFPFLKKRGHPEAACNVADIENASIMLF